MSNTPKLRTRRPTGKPPWPMFCIAGAEKTGKSYGVALFSSSDLIDRTFYLELGEGAADQYGAVTGARYEIVEHDGTFASILGQVQAVVAEPRPNGKPHCIAVDSVTELWDLLSDEAQAKANARAAAKAAQAKRPAPAEDVQITMDLWNEAKKKWRRFLDMVRVYDGPVLLLARLELVATVENGKPTDKREWKIRAEKNLAYECDAIVKIYAPQSAFLTGVRSTVLQVPPGSELPLPQFTIDGLLRQMGLDAEGATAPRSYTAPRAVVDEQPAAEPDRQSQHEHGRSDDEWQAPAPAAEPVANPDDVRHILAGMRQVRGIKDDGALRAAIEAEVRDHVPDPFTLTVSQVARIRTTLEAEHRAQQQAGPGPVGVPNNPEATDRDQRMMHGILRKAGFDGDEQVRRIICRVLRRTITSRKELSRADTERVITAMNRLLETGEMPPEWEPPVVPAGDPAVFDELLQMIGEVEPGSEDALLLAQREIEEEVANGRISAEQLETLRVRLADRTVGAGVAA